MNKTTTFPKSIIDTLADSLMQRILKQDRRKPRVNHALTDELKVEILLLTSEINYGHMESHTDIHVNCFLFQYSLMNDTKEISFSFLVKI